MKSFLQLIPRHVPVLILLLLAICLISPSTTLAQSTGSSISECTSGMVDSPNEIEQTVCFTGGQGGLEAYVETDDDGYENFGPGTGYPLYVASVGAEAQTLGTNGADYDSGMQYFFGDSPAEIYSYFTPQLNIWYYLYGLYAECYDPSGYGNTGDCSWQGSIVGLSLTAKVTPTSLLTPTVTVSTSGTPSIYGHSVTFTATVTSGATGNVEFYANGNYVGTAVISGTTATYTTSSLAVGAESITADYEGNSTYSAVLSTNAVQQFVATAQSVIPIINGNGLSLIEGPPGMGIVITGSGFGSTQGASQVTFQTQSASPVVTIAPVVAGTWTNGSITIDVPNFSPGSPTIQNIVVTNANQTTGPPVPSGGAPFKIDSPFPCP